MISQHQFRKCGWVVGNGAGKLNTHTKINNDCILCDRVLDWLTAKPERELMNWPIQLFLNDWAGLPTTVKLQSHNSTRQSHNARIDLRCRCNKEVHIKNNRLTSVFINCPYLFCTYNHINVITWWWHTKTKEEGKSVGQRTRNGGGGYFAKRSEPCLHSEHTRVLVVGVLEESITFWSWCARCGSSVCKVYARTYRGGTCLHV